MERDFKGVWIPKEIWLCKDLSALDKVIYAEISSLDNETHCTASNEYFAEFCDVGVATVTRSIQKLIDKGYIERVSFNGRQRVLKLIKQTNQNDEAPSSKRLSNNIDNNISSNTDILSKDNIYSTDGVCSEPKSDVSSKAYSTEDFLGSRKKVKPTRKLSLFDKCLQEIDSYTQALGLRDLLVSYLELRLAMKDKPIYGVSQWKGILNKLKELEKSGEDVMKVVGQSIEKGYASFYPVSSSNKYNKPQNKEVFSEYGTVSCERSDEEGMSNVEF